MLRSSAPCRASVLCPLQFPLLGALPYTDRPQHAHRQHRGEGFPRSAPAPDPGSRHLHAGHRLARTAGTRQTHPGARSRPGSDAIPTLSALQQWFTRVRLPGSHLTHHVRLFRSAHHPGSFTEAACGGFGPPLHERSRRAHLHHQCSTTTSDTIFYIAPSSCVRGAQITASLAPTGSAFFAGVRARCVSP